MPARSLTAAAVERIKAPPHGQLDHFDSGFPGLALRVSYGGSKSWVFFYRLYGGKLRRLTLGRWPSMDLAAARDAWRDARNLVGKGENPARKKPTQADSFEAVADEWLKRDQAQNRSYREVKRVIDRDVKPAWNGRLIAKIGRRDALELIDQITDRGAVTYARRVQAHLHRLFRWCVGRGILETNPMAELPKPGAPVKRDRVLSDAELGLIWRATTHIEWPFGPIFRLLILTAARREEIGALRWEEIEGDTIQLAAKRVKNAERHNIPLSLQTAAIIEGLPRVVAGDFVFSTTGGKTSVSGWSRAKFLLDEATKNLNNGRALPSWRLHDLRRSAATGLQRLGFNLQVIEAVLGHVSGSRTGVVGIYQRYNFDAEKRRALDAWARHVETIAKGGKRGNVVAIGAKR
jgi:integrase